LFCGAVDFTLRSSTPQGNFRDLLPAVSIFSTSPFRRVRSLCLQVLEHPAAVLDAARGQHRLRRRVRKEHKLPGALALPFSTETLKAEHVLPVGADVSFVLKLCLALETAGAQVTGVPGAAKGAGGHGGLL
jgi:hypothetical protein